MISTITIESKKRYKRMVVAFALCISLLIGSAFALSPSYQKVSMPDPYGIMPLSLDDDSTGRTFTWNKSIAYGPNPNWYTVAPGSVVRDPGTGIVSLASGSGGGTSGCCLGITSGTYIDYVANTSFSTTEYSSLIVSGGIQFYLYSGVRTYAYGYPNTAQILINGLPVADPVSGDSSGNFFFNDLDFELSTDITSVGVRFTYTQQVLITEVGTTTTSGAVSLYSVVHDSINLTPVVHGALDYSPWLDRIISWEQSIYSAILAGQEESSNGVGKLVSVFARDDDIQLRDDVDDTLKEVTTQFYDQTSTSSSSMTVEAVQNVKGISDGMDAMFSSGYSVSDAFTEIAENDDFMSWFTAETAQALDSTGNVAAVGDDDPYNMHFYYDQVNAIAERRGD